jgi:glutamate synthase (NADPH/NADH) large chain
MIETHVELTGSSLGASLLAGWRQAAATFVKVMPRDYKRALRAAEEAIAAVTREQVAHG